MMPIFEPFIVQQPVLWNVEQPTAVYQGKPDEPVLIPSFWVIPKTYPTHDWTGRER